MKLPPGCSAAKHRPASAISSSTESAFDSLSGETALGREAAHSFNRILHAGGDRTGAAIETALSEQLHDPSITVLDHAVVAALAVDGQGTVTGVMARNLLDGSAESYTAARVVLATGGAGHLYSHTTNPDVATGDGIVLAFEAGAEVMDLEFYQFHPTALRLDGQPPFLISEAVRGEGAVLLGRDGRRFMPDYHPDAELAPRDVVARAIIAPKCKRVALTLSSSIARPSTVSTWPAGSRASIASARMPASISPASQFRSRRAAHYFMGGIRTDIDGRSNGAGPLCGGRGRLHWRSRGKPAGLEFPDGNRGFRKASRGELHEAESQRSRPTRRQRESRRGAAM